MADITCMGFNVMAYGTHGAEPPEARYPYVIATILNEMPDLIGIQEASQKKEGGCPIDWVTKLKTDLEAQGYAGRAVCEEKDFAFSLQTTVNGLMIFYKKDRFELKESGALPYPHDAGRYLQWAALYDKKYQRNICFTNTHFSCAPKVAGAFCTEAAEPFRTVEAVRLLNFWLENCDENTALFATGDYNSEPVSLTQRILRSKQFKPSYLVSESPDDRGTVNVTSDSHAIHPHMIDFCFINEQVQSVEIYYAVVRRFETEADGAFAGFASDHRAVMTYCNYI